MPGKNPVHNRVTRKARAFVMETSTGANSINQFYSVGPRRQAIEHITSKRFLEGNCKQCNIIREVANAKCHDLGENGLRKLFHAPGTTGLDKLYQPLFPKKLGIAFCLNRTVRIKNKQIPRPYRCRVIDIGKS